MPSPPGGWGLGAETWNSGVSHTLQDVQSSSVPSFYFQSTSLDLGSTFHPFCRRRLCPVEVDCLARRNTHNYEICSWQKRRCWLKCLLSWCGESAVKICWIQLPSVWCLKSGPQWLGNVSVSGRIHGLMRMEGTLRQAAAENKPSLTQKETGSSVYVCVWLHLPNRYTAERVCMCYSSVKAFTTQRAS